MKFNQLNDLFQVYRQIFCTCSCGEVFRLSDTQIVALKKTTPKDWLSRLQFTAERLQVQVQRAEERFQEKREALMVRNRRAAQRLCHKAVETVIPRFTALQLNTNDIKSIFSPVKFVAFDGLFSEKVKRIFFLDTAAKNRVTERCHKGIEKSIKAGNISWGTIRVNDDGTVVRE